jgi:PilZ domain
MAIDRQSPRKVADRILFIQIEPNNDAIILDVSDGGLGFRALSPLTRSGAICFSFSENGQRIESRGELVWTDSTKKIGGLSFASLPRANRERIRNWVNHAGIPLPTSAASRPAIPASKEPAFSNVDPRRANVAPASTSSFPPAGIPLPHSVTPGFALFEDTAQRARDTWYPEMSVPNSGAKFFSGLLIGAIASAILMAILLFAYSNQIGVPLNEWRARIAVSPVPQSTTAPPPEAAAPPPAEGPSPQVPSGLPPSASIEAPPASAPLSTSADDSKSTDPEAKNPARTQPAVDRVTPAPSDSLPKTAAPGEEDLALAQPYLNNKSGPAGNAVAVRLLWSAVEKGNVQAEITLANLYSRGDGVKKSCDQARVLLRAAAKKGSSEASQELAQIIREGCQ